MNIQYFSRGDIVTFTEGGIEKIGVNIQNATGNHFAPTIIIVEVELVSSFVYSFFSLSLKEYPIEGKKIILNFEKIKTIDKKRVTSKMASFPKSKMKDVDLVLSNIFRFDSEQEAQVVFVDLGRDVMGSEQGGERPGIVVKDFEDKALIAVMTSQLTKREIPTHVVYEEGEAGVLKTSLGLFEQLRYVKKQDIIDYFEYTPPSKIPNVKLAFDISVGLKNQNRRKKMKNGA